MVTISVECSKMERQRVKEDFIILTEITIMGNGKMINHMELVSINLSKEADTKVSGLKISDMVKEEKHGLIVLSSKANSN